MKHLFLVALLTTPTALLIAQSNQTVIDRAQQPGMPPSPPTAQDSVVISPGDADAGNQRIAEPRTLPIKLSAAYDVQAYYVDNVRLATPGSSKEEAVILANTLAVRGEFRSWAIGDALLTPSVGFNFQRFYHGVGQGSEFSDLNFDSYSVPLSLRYRFGNEWEATASLTGGAVYSFEGSSYYHKIFSSWSPSLGLRKLVSVADNQLISLGTGVSYSLTRSDQDSVPAGFSEFRDDRNDKWDLSLDAAYYYLHGKWVISPYVRLAYSDYQHYQETSLLPLSATNVDRRDLTGSAGFSVSYNVTAWASARLFTSYDWRDSEGDDAYDYSYENTNLGVGLSLSASF
jgi:hypothetical protein